MRYTVYVPDEAAARIEAHKHLLNVSEIARMALIEEVTRLDERAENRKSVARQVVDELRGDDDFAKQKELYEERRAKRLERATEIGAQLVATALRTKRVDLDRLSEIDTQPPRYIPPDIDGDLLHELHDELGFDTIPEEYRRTARAAFRETVHMLMER